MGKLNLVDLAGSERQSKAQTQASLSCCCWCRLSAADLGL